MNKLTASRRDPSLREGRRTGMLPAVLLVEDEETDIFLLQKAFAKVDVTNPVHVANHGGEAIDYLKGKGKYADREAFPIPYVMLLDLKLPHTMGLDVIKWVRQQKE